MDRHCWFCDAPVSEDEFCHGCQHYVCDACDKDVEELPLGKHIVDDHQASHG